MGAESQAGRVSGWKRLVVSILVPVLIALSVVTYMVSGPSGAPPGEDTTAGESAGGGASEVRYPGPSRESVEPATIALEGGLKAFSSYEELERFLERLAARQASMGPEVYRGVPMPIADVMAVPEAATATVPTVTPATTMPLPKPAEPGYPRRVSTTNVQVVGIDEPDIVKTDGSIIVAGFGDTVYLVNASGGYLAGKIVFEGMRVSGLFLVDSVLAVLASEAGYVIARPIAVGDVIVEPPPAATSLIVFYNVSDPGKPLHLGEINVTGSLVSARLAGSVVYAVYRAPITGITVPLVNGAPMDPGSIYLVDENPDSYTVIVAVDHETLDYTVKAFMTGPGSRIYMSPERLYVAYSRDPVMMSYYSLQAEFLRALSKLLPDNVSAEVESLLEEGLVARANYVAASYLASIDRGEANSILSEARDQVEVPPLETRIHVFNVSGLNVSYHASFSVPGALLDQFAMEEMGGYFVVATTSRGYSLQASLVIPGPPAGKGVKRVVSFEVVECAGACVSRTVTVEVEEPRVAYEARPFINIYLAPEGETVNNVYVADLSTMNITGLEGLAPGERIYSARLVKDTLFLVTFRQVDPLFAINLSDPTRPEVIGFLKIPGFSEYLHPLSEDLLLGIGRESSYLKVSLFNVSDPTRMEEISKLLVERAQSPALYDHHAVTVDYDYQLVLIPVQIDYWIPAGILAISYKNTSLELAKLLEHTGAQRTVYIGEKLYTISPHSIEVYDINTLEKIGSISLQTNNQ